MTVFVGTAGWSIPKSEAASFETEGTALERYASRFRAVEINSSFHRPHRQSTWAKWASLVPDDFRFAVKIPKTITHDRRLVDSEVLLGTFCDDVSFLGPKLAVLLVQLPPKLAFDEDQAARFFTQMLSLTSAGIACEPRHPSWFEDSADDFLRRFGIARVAADPAPVPASSPGGWRGLAYWRLHGSPRIYRSAYGAARLGEYASAISAASTDAKSMWVMFDNTASSAAATDARLMQEIIADGAASSLLRRNA